MANQKEPQTPETRYVLTMTPEQAHTLCRACELYTRLHIGQLDELSMELMDLREDDFCERRDKAEELLAQLKQIFFSPRLNPSRGASYGVGNDKQSGRAWDIYQVVRYAVAWHDYPEGGYTVHFHKPIPFAGEALATCEVKEV